MQKQMSISKFHMIYTPLSSIEISKSKALKNLEFVRSKTDCEVFPVIKSNAYGHGLEVMCEILKDAKCPYIVVQSDFEAVRVHTILPDQAVLILGYVPRENIVVLSKTKITFSVGDLDSLQFIIDQKIPCKIHLCVDTGMHREGLNISDVSKAVEMIQSVPFIACEGMWSHLADSDNDGSNNEHFERQQKSFFEVVDSVHSQGLHPKWVHLANSHGALRLHDKRLNAVRLGIGLYGLHTAPKSNPVYSEVSKLQPVLSWRTQLIAIRDLEVGESVSYNCTFTAEKPLRIGTIPVGYYDGIFRKMSSRGVFFVDGKKCPILGRVCMNYCVIDLSAIPKAKIGDTVELIGEYVTATQWAEWCETINYEVTTRLSPTVPRNIVE